MNNEELKELTPEELAKLDSNEGIIAEEQNDTVVEETKEREKK